MANDIYDYSSSSNCVSLKDSEFIKIPVINIENNITRKSMIRLNSKQAIKLSKGDTVDFSLFLNKGTILEPVRYSFIKENITVSTITTLEIKADLQGWKKSGITKAGLYSFTFYNNDWYLSYAGHSSELVELENYGITVIGEPKNSDAFSVDYQTPDDGFVVFIVHFFNQKNKEFLLKKIFKSNGETITKRNIRGEVITDITTGNNNVDNDGNMIIKLESDDTSFMPEGEFRYEIQAYIRPDGASEYSVNTVTNRLPFYVLDNDYSANFIYR